MYRKCVNPLKRLINFTFMLCGNVSCNLLSHDMEGIAIPMKYQTNEN